MSMRGAHSGYSIPLLLSYSNSPSLLRYLRFRSRHLCAEHLFPLLSKQGMIHAWLKIVSGLPAISVLSSPPQLLFPPLPFTGATRTATAEAGKPMCDVDRSNNRSRRAVRALAIVPATGRALLCAHPVSVDRPSPPQHPLPDPTWQTAG